MVPFRGTRYVRESPVSRGRMISAGATGLCSCDFCVVETRSIRVNTGCLEGLGCAGQVCERNSTVFVVQFGDARGPGSGRAVTWLACLPRSGASMARRWKTSTAGTAWGVLGQGSGMMRERIWADRPAEMEGRASRPQSITQDGVGRERESLTLRALTLSDPPITTVAQKSETAPLPLGSAVFILKSL